MSFEYNDIHITSGLDVGNGYVKGRSKSDASQTMIDIPSCVSVINRPSGLKPEPYEIDGIMKDIFNELDVTIESPMVHEKRHLFVGGRAVKSDVAPREFNVESHRSKAEDPLSVMLLLACVAGHALQDIYAQGQGWPSQFVRVNAKAALALPIDEYVSHGKAYAGKLKASTHVVTVHNFETPVLLQITFDNVAVFPEGAAAQYAVTDAGKPLMDNLLRYARGVMDKMPPEIKNDNILYKVDSEVVLKAMNTVGIDIGEGTVNFPVFQNGRFAADVSRNMPMGYGTVLEAARQQLTREGYMFKTRKSLSEYVRQEPTAMTKRKYDEVRDIVDQHVTNLVQSIVTDFSRVLSSAGLQTEVVYVYGGGATPVQEELYPALLQEMHYNQQGDVILLYMDSSWSRTLNMEGLFIIASAL